ncbi:MAG: CBS domain-containing protein [bacterium]
MRDPVIDDIMATEVESVDPDMNIKKAASILKDLHIGALMVKGEEGYAGILSERDLVYKITAEGRDPDETLVREVMTPDVTYAESGDSIHACYELMTEHGFRHLPIKSGDEVVGIVSIRSLFSIRDNENQFMISQLKNYINDQHR